MRGDHGRLHTHAPFWPRVLPTQRVQYGKVAACLRQAAEWSGIASKDPRNDPQAPAALTLPIESKRPISARRHRFLISLENLKSLRRLLVLEVNGPGRPALDRPLRPTRHAKASRRRQK